MAVQNEFYLYLASLSDEEAINLYEWCDNHPYGVVDIMEVLDTTHPNM